jgi:hypothetical protein
MSDNGSPQRPHLLRTTPRRDLAGWQLDIKPDPKIGRALTNPARQIPERYGQTRSFCLRVTIRALRVRRMLAFDHAARRNTIAEARRARLCPDAFSHQVHAPITTPSYARGVGGVGEGAGDVIVRDQALGADRGLRVIERDESPAPSSGEMRHFLPAASARLTIPDSRAQKRSPVRPRVPCRRSSHDHHLQCPPHRPRGHLR